MAYHDIGNLWPQEHTTYSDLVSYQDSVYESYDLDTSNAYNVSEFHEPNTFIEYNYHHPDDHDYAYGYGRNSYTSASPKINYYAYNAAEPNLIAYEPLYCDYGYVSYHTHYSVSNSVMDSGFNEPEFEEYDPTPYGGGYDIVSVYGKPLPPSDKTCYPRSKPKPINPTPESMPEPKPVVILKPLPLTEAEHEPRSKPEPEPVPVLLPPPTPVSLVEPEPEPVHVQVPMHEPSGLLEFGRRGKEEYSYPNYGYDYPWPEYDHGYGTGVGYDYGYGKQVVQVPPVEYNPEVVDLCESIFGNWPCLARIRKQQKMGTDHNTPGTTCPQCRHNNPWEDCVNYIFGCSISSSNQ